MLDHLARDLAFAVRSHAKRPGGTAVIVAILALGIAATSVSFSLVIVLLIPPGRRLRDYGWRIPAES